MTLRPDGRTLVRIVGVLVAMFGLTVLVSRPWTLSAQLPAAVLVLVGGSLYLASRARGPIRAKIVVVMLSVLVALYGAELSLALNLLLLIESAGTPEHDRRARREVVFDLRTQGDTAATSIAYPAFLVIHPRTVPRQVRKVMASQLLPLGGLSNRTTVLCNEGGKWAIYRADEHGFRNPVDAWRVPPRVAVVGDSFSHGWCVDDGEDWVSVMRKSVPQILNLGMGANGPLFMMATVREYLTALRPPILIWQYFEGHDTRIAGELKLPILQRYLQEPGYSQELIGRQEEINALVQKVIDQTLQEPEPAASRLLSHVNDALRLSSLRNAVSVPETPSAGPSELALLARVLREVKSTIESWRGKMYFVYLPAHRGLQHGRASSDYASHGQVLALVKDMGVDVVDLYPVFRGHPDPLSLFPYRRNYHYNAAGYALVADAVLKHLRASGWDGRGHNPVQ